MVSRFTIPPDVHLTISPTGETISPTGETLSPTGENPLHPYETTTNNQRTGDRRYRLASLCLSTGSWITITHHTLKRGS